MLTRKNMIKLVIILLLFSIGFFLRVESINLLGIPPDEKSYFQDENGFPYTYDMDPYYNYRLTRNYLDHGYLGDTIINGTEWDLHSYYPPGVPVGYPPLIVYFATFIYKLINLFATVPLIKVCFWLPAFVAPLSAIPAYLFVRRLTNDFGGITAGILVTTTPIYFMRTVPGFFDTDMFNVLFPLLVVWFFFEAVYTEKIKIKILFVFLSAICMFLFSMAWVGWWYLFLVMVLSCSIYIIGCRSKRIGIKDLSYVFGAFLALSVILICIFEGSNLFKLLVFLFEFAKIGSIQNPWAPWPDVYISVSELQTFSLKGALSTGGYTFGLGILSIFALFILKIKNIYPRFVGKIHWFLYFFLVFWILTGLCALTIGIRFMMIIISPLVISAGLMIGICVASLTILKGRKNLFKILSLCALFVFITPPILGAYESLYVLVPCMGDEIGECARWIHNNTQSDTIVVSEWNYGHFFAAVSDRPVIFDGRLAYIENLPIRQLDSSSNFSNRTPNTSRDYWINKALSTTNESLSVGILKMLTTSGDSSYLTLDKYTKNTTKSVEILNGILGVDKELARDILIKNHHLNRKQADDVLKYTHPDNPRPFVLVTYDRMINGGYWIFHFGEWDFNKMKGGNYTYSFSDIKITNNILKTDDGILMDLKTGRTTWYNKTPYCVILVSKDKIQKRYLDKKNDFCVILLMDNEKAVVIDRRFENSMFTKLVLEKRSTAYFKPMYKNKKVVVWKATIC